MVRKPRIEFPGAFYHVITRGNQKQNVFRSAEDRQGYLKVLVSYKERYRFLLYAYVLMDNHVHLLLETQETHLSRVLQGINQSYTIYFNRKYKTIGHLFQGRYKAILCDRDEYLLGLVKYIHFNPIRAGMAENLDAYPYSSHHAYTGRAVADDLVDADMVLGMFSKSRMMARKGYLSYMGDDSSMAKDRVYATIDQRLQGDEGFIEWVKERYTGVVKDVTMARKYSLPGIAEAVAVACGVPVDEMRAALRTKTASHARKVFACAARKCGYRTGEVARFLEKDPSAITGYNKADLAEELARVIGLLQEEGR